MNTPIIQNPETNQQFISNIPLGRWGKVEEVGGLSLLGGSRVYYWNGCID
jgi:hypothetical protein